MSGPARDETDLVRERYDRRVRTLFPEGKLSFQRMTLAPPIARRVTKVHPSLYQVFNALPLLRAHVLAWIGEGVSGG